MLFKADGTKLLLLYAGKEILLQRGQGDSFLSTVQGGFSDYSLVFGRDQGSSKMAKPADNDAAPPPPPTLVVEVGYGPEWYTNGAYEGEREWAAPPQYSAFSGRYRSPGGDDIRVFVRKDRLWLGDSPLNEIGSSLFRVGEDAWSPDTAEFLTSWMGRRDCSGPSARIAGESKSAPSGGTVRRGKCAPKRNGWVRQGKECANKRSISAELDGKVHTQLGGRESLCEN